MNRWGIPQSLEKEILARDQNCIYCGVELHHKSSNTAVRKARASWEHIVNDASIRTPENIALCCISCNASKGARDLKLWLNSKYCISRGITAQTIAAVARAHLQE